MPENAQASRTPLLRRDGSAPRLYARSSRLGLPIRYASAPVLVEDSKMLRTRVLIIALAMTSATPLAFAQALPKAGPMPSTAQPMAPGAMPQRPSRFDEIDTNHDGFITRDEFLASEKKRFEEFDTNHDGKIDAKEIASSPPLMERNVKTAERMLKQWDANGDGIVTTDEYDKAAQDRFAKQDKEGTGKISRRAPPAIPPGQAPQQPLQPVPPTDGKH
jgi:Ca2+-binding EF-hand superfamily protein